MTIIEEIYDKISEYERSHEKGRAGVLEITREDERRIKREATPFMQYVITRPASNTLQSVCGLSVIIKESGPLEVK